jgi:hypothetical protein
MSTIIIAWLENDGTRLTDEWERFDGANYRRKLEVVPQAHAAVWVNRGTAADRQSAEDYVRRDHADKRRAAVFAFPTTEQDPLGRARREIAMGVEGAIIGRDGR